MPRSVANPLHTQAVQNFLPGFNPVQDALAQLAAASGKEGGAVFTRREVVEFILDLSGYTTDVPLHQKRLLEPSFGGGEFLLVAVERLFNAYQAQEDSPPDIVADLRDAIRGVELHQQSFVETRATLLQLLARFGASSETAQILLSSWLVQGDFLLEDFSFAFSHVVGNPPYVRHELIPDELMTEYRKRFQTIFDRADLYIPFIEKALLLLEPRGTLGMICSDMTIDVTNYEERVRQAVREFWRNRQRASRKQHGGDDSLENLALACQGCNLNAKERVKIREDLRDLDDPERDLSVV